MSNIADTTVFTVKQERVKSVSVLPDVPHYDVLIVGAGIAGASLAWCLGRQGMNVAVIERDLTEPEKIIGELLQPGGVMKLQELGYTDVLEGFDAQEIAGYALFMNERHFNIPYPEFGRGGIKGRGFRYGKFVSSLRQQLQDVSCVTLIEGAVHELIRDANDVITGVKYLSKEDHRERSARAHLTVICDGGFSKFREELNESKKQVKGFMLGLLLKNCVLPYPHHGHVFLGGASPFLSYPVSSTETRMLIDFPGAQPPRKDAQLQQYLHQSVHSQLPQGMREPFLQALEEDKFKAMPNAMVASKPVRKRGVVLLGDSLNMRHPLTGGGMTAALTDVQLLRNLLFKVSSFKKEDDIQRAVDEFYRRRHIANATINILADALYEVMSHTDLKEACFNYLEKGNKHVEAPISILSAVSRDQELLIRKFFSVAVFGATNLLQPFPTGKRVARSYHLIRKAVNIITPLLRNEKPSLALQASLKVGEALFPK